MFRPHSQAQLQFAQANPHPKIAITPAHKDKKCQLSKL